MSDGGQQEGAAAGTCEKAAQGASCVPCSSMDPSHLLGKAEIERKLSSELPLWQLVSAAADDQHDHIRRKFTAKNFQCALDCVNAMGAIAEREGHHPDFHITSYRDVEVVIYTHKLDGVTGADLALATMFDREVKCEYSPKWLRDHPEAQGTAK